MRRALPAIVMTVGGLALLLSFHTTAGTQTQVLTKRATPTQPATTAPPPPTTGGPALATTTTSAPARRNVDGQAVENRYGVVQVRVVLEGTHIVDVQALQLPSDRERSQEISGFAEPELRREVLRAQSANIDFISGATYTSDSYQQSLQSALNQAGM